MSSTSNPHILHPEGVVDVDGGGRVRDSKGRRELLDPGHSTLATPFPDRLPTETKVERGTIQSKNETTVNASKSGLSHTTP